MQETILGKDPLSVADIERLKLAKLLLRTLAY